MEELGYDRYRGNVDELERGGKRVEMECEGAMWSSIERGARRRVGS